MLRIDAVLVRGGETGQLLGGGLAIRAKMAKMDEDHYFKKGKGTRFGHLSLFGAQNPIKTLVVLRREMTEDW